MTKRTFNCKCNKVLKDGEGERCGACVKKNIQEWAKLEGYFITDPDGFDRTQPDVMTKLITKEEFDKGFLTCTVETLAKGDQP